MTGHLPEGAIDLGSTQPGDETPAPGAAPVPVSPEPPQEPQPGQEEAAVTEPAEDQSGRAAELEAELAKIRAGAMQGARVLMRIAEGSPHSSITFAGVTVGTEPTPVPAHVAPALAEAAATAGVDLIQTDEGA